MRRGENERGEHLSSSSCTLWLLYGYSANNSAIMTTNFIGASLQMLYALTYLRYTPDKVDDKENRKQKNDTCFF